MADGQGTTKPDRVDRLLDVASKLLPVLVAVGGGLWALFTYIDHAKEVRRSEEAEAKRQEQTRLVEAQKPFLEKQLSLYFEAVQVTGRIVVSFRRFREVALWEDTDLASARARFWQLYWSELSMVESREVERSMIAFGNALKELEPLGDAPRIVKQGADPDELSSCHVFAVRPIPGDDVDEAVRRQQEAEHERRCKARDAEIDKRVTVLANSAYELAHAIRSSIEESWGLAQGRSGDGENQKPGEGEAVH